MCFVYGMDRSNHVIPHVHALFFAPRRDFSALVLLSVHRACMMCRSFLACWIGCSTHPSTTGTVFLQGLSSLRQSFSSISFVFLSAGLVE